MFVHGVYFWLREDLTLAEQSSFAAGLRSLRWIEGVQHGYIGVRIYDSVTEEEAAS